MSRPKPPRQRTLIPAREVASRLMVDEKTVRRWVAEGKLVPTRHYLYAGGGRRVFVWPAIHADFVHDGKENAS